MTLHLVTSYHILQIKNVVAMKVAQQLHVAHEPIKHLSLIVKKQLAPVQSLY